MCNQSTNFNGLIVLNVYINASNKFDTVFHLILNKEYFNRNKFTNKSMVFLVVAGSFSVIEAVGGI